MLSAVSLNIVSNPLGVAEASANVPPSVARCLLNLISSNRLPGTGGHTFRDLARFGLAFGDTPWAVHVTVAGRSNTNHSSREMMAVTGTLKKGVLKIGRHEIRRYRQFQPDRRSHYGQRRRRFLVGGPSQFDCH